MERGASDRAAGRLGELAAQYDIAGGSIGSLASILEALSDEHAPTAVRDPNEGVDVHIADALSGLAVSQLSRSSVIVDIGSGCGIPGLVLAAALPQATLVAVEASGRRCDFIREAAAGAGLANVDVVCARAEEWLDGIGTADAVVARALASTPVLLEYAAPLLKADGILVAWKGTPDDDELAAGSRAASELGMSEIESVSVEPWPGGGSRQLLVSRKVHPTPDRYPRRAGIAAKRPIGL